MALIASSTSLPMVGCRALAMRRVQRASFGIQEMFVARYASGYSGSAPSAFCAASSSGLTSKASEMYLRKIEPRTTCLYSAASMWPRSLSAAAHGFSTKPGFALLPFVFSVRLPLDIVVTVHPCEFIPHYAPVDHSRYSARLNYAGRRSDQLPAPECRRWAASMALRHPNSQSE